MRICIFVLLLFHAFLEALVPPTEAFVNTVSMETIETESKWDVFNDHKRLFDTIIQKEAEYNDQYHVVYHAHIGMMLYQDLLKTLYEVYYDQALPEDFYFLRLPQQAIFDLKNRNDFFSLLKEQCLSKNTINDELKEIRRVLLSVNLSLFSNFDNEECSTLAFWLCGARSFKPPKIDELLGQVLDYFDIDRSELEKVLKIYEPVKQFDAILLQIFLPRKDAVCDDILYFSHDRGIPCEHIQLDQSPSVILNQFQENMEILPHFKTLQARLVITNDNLLNPDSGIKMKRYHTIECSEELDSYRKQLRIWASNSYL